MKNKLSAFVAGLIFAVGLGVADMTNPNKILGFLDVFGSWDGSLIFVMVGGIGVHVLTYRWIKKRNSPLFDLHWHVPTKTEITPSLVIGSVLFGIGWGLGGYCPGPAIVSMSGFEYRPTVFVVSMLFGMVLFHIFDKKLSFKR